METDLLKIRRDIIDYVQNTITSSENNAKGLRSMKERGFSEQGMLDKVIEVTAIQAQQIKQLAQIVLVYAKSDEFTSKLAMSLVIENEENKK